MPTVTFYKTNMNRSNRAYDGAALSSILSAASSLSVDIGKQVIPDTPFAMTQSGTSGQDIILSGYDYISYDYAGKTWYAFIDNIQPLATAEGQLFVEHTTDKWAMAVTYYNGNLKLFGNVQRAHVNDLTGTGSIKTITLANTTGAVEAPYNSALSKTGRAYMPQLNYGSGYQYKWAYIHFNNEMAFYTTYGTNLTDTLRYVSAIGKYALYNTKQVHNALATSINTSEVYGWDSLYGVTLCIPCVRVDELLEQAASIGGSEYVTSLSSWLGGSWALVMPQRVYSDDSPYVSFEGVCLQGINDLTGENITSITISDIPPFPCTITNTSVKVAGLFWHGQFNDLSDDTSLTITVPWVNGINTSTGDITSGSSAANFLIQLLYKSSANYELLTGYPMIPMMPNVFTSHSVNFANLEARPPVSSTVYISTEYSSYIQNIPKYLTSIYHPMYVGDTFINNLYLTNQTIAYYVSLSMDLTQLMYWVRSSQFEGKFLYSRNNLQNFAPPVTLDYWTRLNATQTAISASKMEINTVFNAVGSVVGGGIGANSAYGQKLKGKTASSYLSAAGTAVSTAQSLATFGYDIEYANNMKEIAQYQYNTGVSSDTACTGLADTATEISTCLLTWVDNTANQEMICLNLHRYGYNTFLPIDVIYENHRRTYFNYFQGANVSVSGLPQVWCDEISAMFNSGVTLWHTGVGEYEVCNYQESFT